LLVAVLVTKKQYIAEMLNDNFLTMADTYQYGKYDNTDDNALNIDNDNFMCVVSHAYSKFYLPMYSKPSTAQEIENIIH
jgi:hypothetical protein